MSSPAQGFTPVGHPPACPCGYMANGSFHGDLLSDHKTTIVSLTHQIHAAFVACASHTDSPAVFNRERREPPKAPARMSFPRRRESRINHEGHEEHEVAPRREPVGWAPPTAFLHHGEYETRRSDPPIRVLFLFRRFTWRGLRPQPKAYRMGVLLRPQLLRVARTCQASSRLWFRTPARSPIADAV